jgi:hypothetical protein
VGCDACHLEQLVAFRCKRRGFCPNCGGRRMAEAAALLTDRGLPSVPLPTRAQLDVLLATLNRRIPWNLAGLVPSSAGMPPAPSLLCGSGSSEAVAIRPEPGSCAGGGMGVGSIIESPDILPGRSYDKKGEPAMAHKLQRPGPLAFLATLSVSLVPLLAAETAQASSFTVQITFSPVVENDATFSVSVNGVSNGLPFVIDTPASGMVVDLFQVGDFVTSTVSGEANSDPSGDAELRGGTSSSLAQLIRFGDDWGNGATGEPPEELGGVLWLAAIAMAWEIDADGADAFSNTTQSITANGSPVVSGGCLSDTLFGDVLNGVDRGTFGAPCTSGIGISWAGDALPSVGVPGASLANATGFSSAEAFASSARYTNAVTFSIIPVPAPPAAVLALSGCLSLLGWTRRRPAGSLRCWRPT